MMKIKTTTTALSYATFAVGIGLVGHYLQRQEWSSSTTENPIHEACTSVEYKSMNDFVKRSGYQPYNTRVGLILGDPIVCIMTQQLHQWLTESDNDARMTTALLLWCIKLMLQLPVGVLVLVEAIRARGGGRRQQQQQQQDHHHKGILLWPTLVSILCYCLGTSIIFPSLWVSHYCLLGGGSSGSAGEDRDDTNIVVHGNHPKMITKNGKAGGIRQQQQRNNGTDSRTDYYPLRAGSVLVYLTSSGYLPTTLLFVGCITIYHWNNSDSSVQLWNVFAGLLGSPILALLPLTAWKLLPSSSSLAPTPQSVQVPPPTSPSSSSKKGDFSINNNNNMSGSKGRRRDATNATAAAISNTKEVAFTYGVVGILSFLGWLTIVYTFVARFGHSSLLSVSFWRDNVWYYYDDIDPSVRIILIEMCTLGMSWMTYLASQSEWSALEGMIMTPIIGPGAALAMELASLELEKLDYYCYFAPCAASESRHPATVVGATNKNNSYNAPAINTKIQDGNSNNHNHNKHKNNSKNKKRKKKKQ